MISWNTTSVILNNFLIKNVGTYIAKKVFFSSPEVINMIQTHYVSYKSSA